jgi:hypothetical protein
VPRLGAFRCAISIAGDPPERGGVRGGWLTTSVDLALALQQPLPDDELMIVATGERKDEAA